MRSNVDGTYLDGDGRPLPSAGPAVGPVDPWKALSRRTRSAVRWSYGNVAIAAAGAVLAWVVWIDAGWGWLPAATVVLTLWFAAQVALLLVLWQDPDVVRRRTYFAVANCLFAVLVDVALLLSVMIDWGWVQGVTPGPPQRVVVAVLLFGLAVDMRVARLWWVSMPV